MNSIRGSLEELAGPGQIADSVRPQQHRIPVIDVLRKQIHSRWPEWITLTLYAAIVSFAIPYHEPWADEAQAWQLARSLSLHDLFHTYIRYEGSPGLWHFLLWIMIRAHVSYTGMHWICGAIALAGVSVLVLKSPFPRYLKLLLPFTYFLLFQYAVVARSYVLVPLLLFMIAAYWKRSSILIALMLGLLANLALHAAVISGGLAIVYCIAQGRKGGDEKPRRRRDLITSTAVLLAFYAFALWTAWPPRELLQSRTLGSSRPFVAYSIVSLVWGVCEPWILSILFWIAIAFCLRGRKGLSYLLPVLLFAIFSGTVYANFWHVGLLVPLVIALLWITWPLAPSFSSHYETIGRAALLFMAGVQILWSGYAIAYDHSHAYSPDLAAAQFLKPLVDGGSTIALTYSNQPHEQAYDSVGILPYFDRNIYLNQPDSFWWWSPRNPTEKLFPAAMRSHPDIVLVETRQTNPGQPVISKEAKVELLRKAGYELTNVFCGVRPERLALGERSCHLIFRRLDRLRGHTVIP